MDIGANSARFEKHPFQRDATGLDEYLWAQLMNFRLRNIPRLIIDYTASSFFSSAFSSSSDFKRFASDTSTPPYVVLLIPFLRHTSAVFAPASCSRKIPMICSFVNRLGFMSIPSRRWTLPLLGGVLGAHITDPAEVRSLIEGSICSRRVRINNLVNERPRERFDALALAPSRNMMRVRVDEIGKEVGFDQAVKAI